MGVSRELHTGHVALLSTLLEALRAEVGGEVVAKCELYTARIYVYRGHVVWATASTHPRTFGRHLIESKLISEPDLAAVVAECKQTGANFAETVVSWGLIKMETLRSVLLKYVAEGLLQPFSWPSLVTMFVPSSRSYAGRLSFELGETLRAAAALDSARGTALPALVEKMGEGDAVAALAELIEARRQELPVPPAIPPVEVAGPKPAGGAAPGAKSSPAASADAHNPQVFAALERVSEQLVRIHDVPAYRASGVMALAGGAPEVHRVDMSIDIGVVTTQLRNMLAVVVEKLLPSGWTPSDIMLETPQGSLLIHPVESHSVGYLAIFVLVGPETRCSLLRMRMDRLAPDLLEALR